MNNTFAMQKIYIFIWKFEILFVSLSYQNQIFMENKIHTQVPHNMGKKTSEEDIILKPIDHEVYLEMKHNIVDFTTMTVPVSTLSIANKLKRDRRTIQKSIDKLIKTKEIEKVGVQGLTPVYKFFKTKRFEKFSNEFIEKHRDMPDRANYIALQEFGKKEGNMLFLHKNINELAKEMHIKPKALMTSFDKWEEAQILTQSWDGDVCTVSIDLSQIGQAIFNQILENSQDIKEVKDELKSIKSDLKEDLKEEIKRELLEELANKN